MRIYLQLTKSNQTIPFNYQNYLTGTIHKWLGHENRLHHAVSMFSFSWFQNTGVDENRKGIIINEQSSLFISAFDPNMIKKIVAGIMTDPSICFGVAVNGIEIVETPIFAGRENFNVGSPVLIKRRVENSDKHFTYQDPGCNDLLTQSLKNKLAKAGLPIDGVSVKFNPSFTTPKIKIIRYKEINNRVNICPVTIEGSPEQLAFAWNVGIGNSTGIGFGSLK